MPTLVFIVCLHLSAPRLRTSCLYVPHPRIPCRCASRLLSLPVPLTPEALCLTACALTPAFPHPAPLNLAPLRLDLRTCALTFALAPLHHISGLLSGLMLYVHAISPLFIPCTIGANIDKKLFYMYTIPSLPPTHHAYA